MDTVAWSSAESRHHYNGLFTLDGCAHSGGRGGRVCGEKDQGKEDHKQEDGCDHPTVTTGTCVI